MTHSSLSIPSSYMVYKRYFAHDSLYSCVVPEVHLENSVFQFQHCFLDYPYEQTIKLINDTNLPACYGLLAKVK